MITVILRQNLKRQNFLTAGFFGKLNRILSGQMSEDSIIQNCPEILFYAAYPCGAFRNTVRKKSYAILLFYKGVG